MAKKKVEPKTKKVDPKKEVEKKENPGAERANVSRLPDPIQLELKFHERVADAVYAYRVENRRKGLEMILKGFALIGATHETAATMLDRIWEDVPELRQALDEMKPKKAK